jgi:lantibiotic modifying enzyme
VLGLLVLNAMQPDGDYVLRAAALADVLCDKNIRDNRWAPPPPGQRPLTGFAHGAAGVGYALSALSDATRNPGYRHAATVAFGYERAVFDPAQGNWPDFRAPVNTAQAGVAFAVQWCHGAPGIALSRLYAMQGDDGCRAEVAAGLATTRRAITHRLAGHTGNFSLCHGLAGNAEALRCASDIAGAPSEEGLAIAMQVAEYGLERYPDRDRKWPCGVPDGTSYDLMRGLAGIGHFYLRWYDPTVPSVLLLHPRSFRSAVDG